MASSGLSSSATSRPVPAAKPAKTAASKPASKKATPPSSPTPNQTVSNKTPPPSNSLNSSSSSWSTNKEQSYSFNRSSSDGYSLSSETRSVTTSSSTGLVDNLVKAFAGESSCESSTSFSRSSSGSTPYGTSSDGHNHTLENCAEYSERSQQRFEHINAAREQLGTARGKVQRVLDAAVEAKLNDAQDVPESVVKTAEKEQEQLTKAEGRLDRTQGQLCAKQETMRQHKNQFNIQRQAAKDQLLNKFSVHRPELRDDLMEKLQPMLNKDSTVLNNPQQLDEAAKWHIKNDPKTSRLFGEEQPEKPESDPDQDDPDSEKEPKKSATKSPLQKRERPSAQERADKKRQRLERDLRQKLEGTHFQDQVKETKLDERSNLVTRELKPLNSVSPRAARELEEKLNLRYTETERQGHEAGASGLEGKSQEQKQQTIDRLLAAKQTRSSESGHSAAPLSKAIDDIDTESIKQTTATLKNLDMKSIRSLLDLERSFGQDISQVRSDLERQIGRGGRSTNKAQKALDKLDRTIRQSKLLSSQDSWAALRQSSNSTGPNLGNFLGIPDGVRSGNSPLGNATQPSKSQAEPDYRVSKTLLKRLRDTGSRADDSVKRDTLARLRAFGA